MAVKKVRIPLASLPPADSDNNYHVRYRIVSEDRNRVSHWSPTIELSSLTVSAATTASLNLVSTDAVNSLYVFSLIWEDDNGTAYDIFTSVDPAGTPALSDYVFHGRTSLHNYNFVTSSSATNVYVRIQVAGSKQEPSDVLDIASVSWS